MTRIGEGSRKGFWALFSDSRLAVAFFFFLAFFALVFTLLGLGLGSRNGSSSLVQGVGSVAFDDAVAGLVVKIFASFFLTLAVLVSMSRVWSSPIRWCVFSSRLLLRWSGCSFLPFPAPVRPLLGALSRSRKKDDVGGDDCAVSVPSDSGADFSALFFALFISFLASFSRLRALLRDSYGVFQLGRHIAFRWGD